MHRRAGSVGGSRAFERVRALGVLSLLPPLLQPLLALWPTNSERGCRGPRQRKHPLRSPARERRAAGAAAPGEADERRQRPLDNLRPTGAARQQVATSGGLGPAAGAAAGGGIPQGAAHRRGRASAHGAEERNAEIASRLSNSVTFDL